MDVYRVSLIGHRHVEHPREVEDRLLDILPRLLRTKAYVEFFLGRNGEFDILAASCIKQVQHSYGKQNSAMTLVLPYAVADMAYYRDYYDSILIPEVLAGVHPKRAITARNRWMVENTALLLAYVRREKGGSAMCLHMAQAAGIDILRL